MNIKNNLKRIVTVAVTAGAIGVGATGVASASTAQPTAVTSVSHQVTSETAALQTTHHYCYYGWGPGPGTGWRDGWHWVGYPVYNWEYGWYYAWWFTPYYGWHC
jgi:hypothetical protein